MQKTGIATIGLFCFLSFGCAQKSETDALRSQLADSTTQLTKVQEELDALKEQVTELRQKVNWTEVTEDWDRIAYLTPGDEGYSTVGFDLGTLTVQLTDVKPYANGSKVTLRFGNTLSSSINGLKATIDWGRVKAGGGPDNDSQKSKDASFVQTIRAGAWTAVSIVLEGVPPTELGFVRVSKVSHTGIRLAT
jgi:hypothetical protein